MILSPKQAKGFLEANSRWNLFIGATRSGKSHTQQLLIPRRIKEGIPGLYLLMAKTLGNVESNILFPMREIYGNRYVSTPYMRHGVTKARVFGQEFYCLGGDNIRAVDKLRGKTIGYAAVDEGPTLPQELMQMLKTRMTHPKAKSDQTGNPEGPYHSYKRDLIDRAAELGVYHLSFGLDDNPTLTEEMKQQLRSELTGVWYKRLILGLWVAAEGAVYDMFDEQIHIVRHLPQMVRYWVGADYGTASVTTWLLVGLGVDNCLYVIDEYRYDATEQRQKTDAEFSRDYRKWIEARKAQPTAVFIDPSATSFIAQLHSDGVRNLAHADNTVLDGIRRTGNLLAAKRLFVHERCKGLVQEISGYVWDAKAQEHGEDAPVKANDHEPDALRYITNGTRHIWYRWLRGVDNAA